MGEAPDNIPLTLNVAGIAVTGAVVFLRPNDIVVAIVDGSGPTKSLHAFYIQMGYGRRDPNRWHYAVPDEHGCYNDYRPRSPRCESVLAALHRGRS